MPELPEVETIVRNLRTEGSLVGKKIHSAELLWRRTLATPDEASFYDRIRGQVILAVNRRAKYLVFSLTSDVLLIHLRMSGDLRVEKDLEEGRLAHDRMLLHFEDGFRLAFNDTRKFGRVWLVEDAAQVLGTLGPEPLEPSFTAKLFYERLASSGRQLKPLLMDQRFLAGLGNIYTDEALYLAKIHPLRSANSLTLNEAGCLLESIRSVLEEGIRRNGASIDWVYRGGQFQNSFQVYQRTGLPCRACGHPIERCLVGQRGTHFCPVCQVK